MGNYRTWGEFAKAMERRANEMPDAFREGTTNATNILHVEAKKLLRELVYDKPEDRTGWSYRKKDRGTPVERFTILKSGKRGRSKSGRKKWTRTGNLRRSEKKSVVSPVLGVVNNDANYALPRHDLGLPAGSPEAIKGSRRKSERIAPWRTRAIANTDQARREAYRDAIWERLRQG